MWVANVKSAEIAAMLRGLLGRRCEGGSQKRYGLFSSRGRSYRWEHQQVWRSHCAPRCQDTSPPSHSPADLAAIGKVCFKSSSGCIHEMILAAPMNQAFTSKTWNLMPELQVPRLLPQLQELEGAVELQGRHASTASGTQDQSHDL